MSAADAEKKPETEKASEPSTAGELLYCGGTNWECLGRKVGGGNLNLVSATRLRPLVGVHIRFVALGSVSDAQDYIQKICRIFFSMCVDITDNELAYLECIHLFVEILDHFFSYVCELDLVFNFHKVHLLLDEFILAGELQETS